MTRLQARGCKRPIHFVCVCLLHGDCHLTSLGFVASSRLGRLQAPLLAHFIDWPVCVSEPPPEDADGDDGPTDAGMTQTDVYIEQKERKQQKKYDSDDDGEPDRQGKKKKMKNVARGFGSLPVQPPAPPGSLIPKGMFRGDLSRLFLLLYAMHK